MSGTSGYQHRLLSLDDYEQVGFDPLGSGTFASVRLVRHKITKSQFAIKAVSTSNFLLTLLLGE